MTRYLRAHRWLAGLACLLMVALGSGCSTPRPAPPSCDQPEANCVGGVLAALQAWQDAYNQRDPVALRRLYAPGALITDDEFSAVPQSGEGLPVFFDDLARRPTARMRWVIGNLNFFGNTAVRSGECEFDEEVDGKPVTRPVRYSLAYQRFDGEWLIVLQHLTIRP